MKIALFILFILIISVSQAHYINDTVLIYGKDSTVNTQSTTGQYVINTSLNVTVKYISFVPVTTSVISTTQLVTQKAVTTNTNLNVTFPYSNPSSIWSINSYSYSTISTPVIFSFLTTEVYKEIYKPDTTGMSLKEIWKRLFYIP